MTEYGVVYQPQEDGTWLAYAAGLDVSVTAGSIEAAEAEIRSAIADHLEEFAKQGKPEPRVNTAFGTVTV